MYIHIYIYLLFRYHIDMISTHRDIIWISYKCHIETPNGDNIALFTWDKALVIEEQSALLAQYVPTISNERLIVKRVVECITEDKVFKDLLIRELDAQRTY